MSTARTPLWVRCWGGAAVLLAVLVCAVSSPAVDRGVERALATMRPDYRVYVRDIRPLEGDARASAKVLYMALVRPGASDPSRSENAPFLGPGARNDILYDPTLFEPGGSAGWVLLLLDHEYFHARHLAGATGLPVPPRATVAMESHFYEAAAWGFNVAQARSGRYPGLSEEEFREALDRYGEHYRALRDLTREGGLETWERLEARLRHPEDLLTTNGSPAPEAPAHPSDPDPSATIP
ncbi:MAG TPA: hypothetical protein VFB95_08035 [Candidatus Cryosericum sp.]|nr:hypothetical protein [Candidatus Cryosericum sp.]